MGVCSSILVEYTDLVEILYVDTIDSSPVASNALYTYTELSFLQVLGKEDGFLFSCSQARNLFAFTLHEQYMTGTSSATVHDTNAMQYNGRFGSSGILKIKTV